MLLKEKREECRMLETKNHIERILVLLTLSVIVLYSLRGPAIADPDLWGYMSFGRLFSDSGTFPRHDIYTYLPTHDRWIYHEWLTGVGSYFIYKFTGGFGLIVVRDMVALATLCFLYLAARIRSSSRLSALLWILLASPFLKVGFGTVLRAQISTYLFTAVALYLLERSRQKGQWLPLSLLVPMQIVWCNLHGGFLAGLGIIVIYIVGEAFSRRTWWPYLLDFLVSALSTLINPYGLDYWRHIFYAITLPRPEITEWVSTFSAYRMHIITLGHVFWYVALGILSLRILVKARWRDVTSILLLSATFLLGIRHFRHQVFFPMLVAVYLPEPFQPFIEQLQSQFASLRTWLREKVPALFAGSRHTATFFIAVLSLLFCFFLGSSSFSLIVPSREEGAVVDYPSRAVEYMKKHYSSGNVLTEFVWGEYLIWNLGPRMKVGLDGRYESVYQDHVANEYFDYINGRKDGFLEAYAHDLVLIRPHSAPVSSLRHSPDWSVAYEDSDAILFTRVGR